MLDLFDTNDGDTGERRRKTDTPSSKVKRFGGTTVLAAFVGVLVGWTQLAPYTPTAIKAKADAAEAATKANSDALETHAERIRLHERDELSRLDRLETTVTLQNAALVEDVQELKEDLRALRSEIRQWKSSR